MCAAELERSTTSRTGGKAPVHIFVPRWMNRANNNAQNANAKALLSRFSSSTAHWTAIYSDDPVESVTNNGIDLIRLSHSRWWQFELLLAYQRTFDAIFYPGVMWPDEFGIKLQHLVRRRIPRIATMEGIIASPEKVAQVSAFVGHPVFAQPGVDAAIPRIRWMYETADHIIAISPFLARVATLLYGDKVSCLPLGLDHGIFHNDHHNEPARCRVVGCGTVKSSKNPQLFLELAARYRNTEFVWFGDGAMRPSLLDEARRRGLDNLTFPGALQPDILAEEFRNSSFFVLPSHAEGVPKVTQEAAACGLPIVLNGYFEAPTVLHEENGLVAWSDNELTEHVGRLIADEAARRSMGARGAAMVKHWHWDEIAPRWEEVIMRIVENR